jgi:hypothetical protein
MEKMVEKREIEEISDLHPSYSVAAVAKKLSDAEMVGSWDIVKALLYTHREYGSKMGGELYLQDGPKSIGKTMHVFEWLRDVYALLDPNKVETLHGRVVILGLSRLDQNLRDYLDSYGFIDAISKELTPSFESLLIGDEEIHRGKFEAERSETPEMEPVTPTPKVISDHWVTNDTLGYEAYARTIAALITHNETVPPLTIGIKAPWGAGKTSLMKMVQYILDGGAKMTEENKAYANQREVSISLKDILAGLKKDNKEEKEYLFSIDAGLEDELNKSTISEKLKNIFKTKGFPLPENAAIKKMKEEKETEWIISNEEEFIVKKENGKLNIYEKDNKKDFKIEPEASEKGKRYNILPRMTVWFNAWKYQNSDQIWAGLAHCIITQVTARMTPRKRELFWLKLNARRVDREQIRRQAYKLALNNFLPIGLAYAGALVLFLVLSIVWLGLGNLISQLGSLGITVGGILNWFWTKQSKFSEKASGTFQNLVREPDYEGKMGFLHLVESDIREVLDLVATPKSPLVIFIDDLDRCAPHKVAEVVEALNLFLCGDYPNCIFVLGMEPGVVAAALEVANRELIEKIQDYSLVEEQTPLGWRFMEKIIQVSLVIPSPTKHGVQGYLGAMFGGEGLERRSAPFQSQEIMPQEEGKVKEYMSNLGDAKSVAEVIQKTDELIKDSDHTVKASIVEASKRVYSQKFKNRDPIIGQFIESVVTQYQANPRQIKRYINLFRFLSTLRYYISLDHALIEGTRPKMPLDKDLAKFVALCTGWPQATDCLRRMLEVDPLQHSFLQSEEGGPVKAVSILAFLEAKARSLATMNDENGDKAWISFLEENGLKFDWVSSRPFRQLLVKDGSLANFEKCGL